MERLELAARLGGPQPSSVFNRQEIEEVDPRRFMAAFVGAVAGKGNIFLTNPAWRSAERGALAGLPEVESGDQGWLMIPSGGASGGIKFARHDAQTVSAAVEGFREHFGFDRVNAVCVLPLYHVSGFMAWMRSALSGGVFLPCDWKEIERGRVPSGLPHDCCLSLVPTQLQRLLASEAAIGWLRGFKVIFLGGGPSWAALLDEAARLRLPLAPGYGATETAAMVTSLRPGEFLDGRRGCGKPLPHGHVEVDGEGMVRVSGASIFRGYFPEFRTGLRWDSGDIGRLEGDGSLHILGRSDDVIISGGKKIEPSEVEAALRSSGEFEDVAVIGVPNPEWGQLAVACHPAGQRPPDPEKIEKAFSGLASFKRPKRLIALSPWPRNDQGKLNRAELLRLALKA
jgi:O-succinylbenzoic acid--CoA ligase